MKKLFLALLLSSCVSMWASDKNYKISSPNNKISVDLTIGEKIKYTVIDNGNILMKDNNISLNIENVGEIGEKAKVASKRTKSINENIKAPFYKQSSWLRVVTNCKES